MTRSNRKLFRDMAGVKLDVGCGTNKQPGYVGLDRVQTPGVDIVHDIQKFPWPVPSGSCSSILMSRVWEYVEPKHRDRLMNELWRVCRHDGQLLLASPYAGTLLANSGNHYSCPTELTFLAYTPDWPTITIGRQAYPLYLAGQVKPWKIVRNEPNFAGFIEVILEPYKSKDNRVCLPKARDSGKK